MFKTYIKAISAVVLSLALLVMPAMAQAVSSATSTVTLNYTQTEYLTLTVSPSTPVTFTANPASPSWPNPSSPITVSVAGVLAAGHPSLSIYAYATVAGQFMANGTSYADMWATINSGSQTHCNLSSTFSANGTCPTIYSVSNPPAGVVGANSNTITLSPFIATLAIGTYTGTLNIVATAN